MHDGPIKRGVVVPSTLERKATLRGRFVCIRVQSGVALYTSLRRAASVAFELIAGIGVPRSRSSPEMT